MSAISVPMPSDSENAFLASCVQTTQLDSLIAKCLTYGNFLYETNEFLNLTAIPPEQFWNKHICDCLLALREVPECFHGKMADVGCGAGMPSIPIAIARPDLHITAIDSRGKKITFVQNAAKRCGLKNLNAIHGRANELAAQQQFKNAFNVITARAVSDACTLMKECRKLLQPHGFLCIFRTEQQLDDELPDLKKGKVRYASTEPVDLPDTAGRRLFLLLSDF